MLSIRILCFSQISNIYINTDKRRLRTNSLTWKHQVPHYRTVLPTETPESLSQQHYVRCTYLDKFMIISRQYYIAIWKYCSV
jgi:hypothetical protein